MKLCKTKRKKVIIFKIEIRKKTNKNWKRFLKIKPSLSKVAKCSLVKNDQLKNKWVKRLLGHENLYLLLYSPPKNKINKQNQF